MCSHKEHNFLVGDYVLLEQRKRNKWSTPYEPVFYTIIKVNGSAITARRVTDGREIQRDASQFKLANVLMYQESGEDNGHHEDWRESLLMNAGNRKDQPPSQDTGPGRLAEQEATIRSQQGNLTEQSRLNGNQQGGEREPSTPVQDTSRTPESREP